jgi:hypothetical protein
MMSDLSPVEEVYRDWMAVRKNADGITRDIVQGRDFSHGYHRLKSGTRYEHCTFYDAQLRMEGCEQIQIVNPLRCCGSSFYVKDSASIRIADADPQGEFAHDPAIDNLPNNRKGPSAWIRTDGTIEDVRLLGNKLMGVQRVWTGIINGPSSRIVTGFNVAAHRVPSHPAFERCEGFLFHGVDGFDDEVVDFQSYHDTWSWAPVKHHGDMQVGPMYHGGKKPFVDFHNVNARRPFFYRPTFSEDDSIRFTAKEGGHIVGIEIVEANTDARRCLSRNSIDAVKIKPGGLDNSVLGGGKLEFMD